MEVTCPFRRLFRFSSTRIRSEPEEVRTIPTTECYWGKASYSLSHYSLSQIILHSRSVQTSTFLSLLGLTTATLQSVEHAHLHMHYIQ